MEVVIVNDAYSFRSASHGSRRQRTRSPTSRGSEVTLTPVPLQASGSSRDPETEVARVEQLPADPPSYESHHRHNEEQEEEEEEDGSRESEGEANQDPSSTGVRGS